jgi:hypothetical protein
MPKIEDESFYKDINDVIAEKRHVEYLKEVIKQYEEYKKIFAENFTDKNPRDAVYKFRVTYLLKKLVWRDIEILGKQNFYDLADQIIFSMDWENDHMHGFDLKSSRKPDPMMTGSSITIFAPGWEDDPHPVYKTNEIAIADLDYMKQPKLKFMFDYGDGHEFDIEFKGMRALNKGEKKTDFPQLIDQRGIAPEQYPEWDESK